MKGSPVILDPASFTLVDALHDDPFYLAISVEYEKQPTLRRLRLAEYFSYSLEEASILGRCVHLQDWSLGAAAWLLPSDEQRHQASLRKAEFMASCLGSSGGQKYRDIVNWMSKHSEPHVSNAWYLSIVGIAPHVQGKGLGTELLRPTLGEADAARADCYLETFNRRGMRFYERLGFRKVKLLSEPITDSDYALMIRPNALNRGSSGKP